MGQARKRGTFEERKAQAIDRDKAKAHEVYKRMAAADAASATPEVKEHRGALNRNMPLLSFTLGIMGMIPPGPKGRL